MQVNITGHHLDITPPMRAYVTEKMQRISRHFDQVNSINVILKVEKLEQHAEATINASGRTLFADESDMDMYAAIDGLVDKLDRQVRRLKGKLREHHHTRPEEITSL